MKTRGSLLTSVAVALVLLVVSAFAGLPLLQKGSSSAKAHDQAKKASPAPKISAQKKATAPKQKSTKNSELPHGDEGGSPFDGMDPKEIAALERGLKSPLPFVPRGSDGIAGYWGKVSNGIIDEGNKMASVDYQWYTFRSDGTYLLQGKSLIMDVIDSKGLYRLDGDKLQLVHTELKMGEKWVKAAGYAPFTCRIGKEGDHTAFRAEISDVTFYREVRWDMNGLARNIGCYVNAKGEKLEWRQHEGLKPIVYLREKQPTSGTKEECMENMHNLFRTFAHYWRTMGDNAPGFKTMSVNDYPAKWADPELRRCPISGRSYGYVPKGDVIRCQTCKQQFN